MTDWAARRREKGEREAETLRASLEQERELLDTASSSDAWRNGHGLVYLTNQLTRVLERLDRHEETLAAVRALDDLPPDVGTKADRDELSRRERRLMENFRRAV